MLPHCSPSIKWVPGGNTGEIKVAKQGTGHPTSCANSSGSVSSLTGTPPYIQKYTELPLLYFIDLRIITEFK